MLDIVILYDSSEEKEVLKNIKVKKRCSDVILSTAIKALKLKGYDFADFLIHYITFDDYYVNCWYDPVPESVLVPECDILHSAYSNERVKLFIKNSFQFKKLLKIVAVKRILKNKFIDQKSGPLARWKLR